MEHDDASVIRTPDQRLRVFVSSTLAELADERAAVAKAITSMHLSPVMFELGARPHPPQELYRAYLAQSDIFVGLYWESYGWVGPGMDISGLEDEFRLAGERPRLLYIKAPAPNRQPQLAAMIAEIEADGTVAYRKFRTSRELARLVRDDLAVLLSERFAATARITAQPVATTAVSRSAARSIPVAATALFGREADIEAVVGWLRQPESRLVTLTGPGGIGKTRLAMAVGEAVATESDRAVVFVPLASATDQSEVLPRIAAAVGVTVEGTLSPLSVLSDHFEEPTLLILDNLEQVVAVAPALDQLLMASPKLVVLATSRTVLRLRAEREYAVSGLIASTPSNLEHSPAVRLFADRARSVRSSFAVDTSNVDDIMEICRRLDGLPLAIELAAARVRLLEPAALLRRLENVLDSLGAGPVDLPERQRTLRATVEWSVGLLDSADRQLLEALSAFAGGCSIEAASAVAGLSDGEALDRLDSLAGQSLVSVDTSQSEPRFRMLSSVHEFAGELLAQGSHGAEVVERHARYFAELVADGTTVSTQQSAWADRLRPDEGNLRLAIRWFFRHDIAPLPSLFRSLWLFWQLSDRMPEARGWIDELRLRADDLQTRERAEVMFTWAVTAVEVGDDDSARSALSEIDELRGQLTDPQLDTALQLARSWALPLTGEFETALSAATDALAGFRTRGEPSEGIACLTAGILEMALGRDDDALLHLRNAEQFGARVGNGWLVATARTQLVSLTVRAGQIDEARALLAGALDVVGTANVGTLSATFVLLAAAHVALADENPELAATALAAIHGLRERSGLRAWPTTRRGEEAITAQVERAASDAGAAAAAAGFTMTLRDSLELARSVAG